jgi:hypothetical protein
MIGHIVRVALIALLTTANTAAAMQHTDAPDWEETVQQFLEALQQQDVPATKRLMADRFVIRDLARDEARPLQRLLERTAGSSVLAVQVYTTTPATLAADLSRAVERTPTLPAEVRRWIVPADEPATRRANAVAEQWLNEVLDLREPHPVAVVLLWCPLPNWPGLVDRSQREHQPMFVLLKGERSESGAYLIQRIAFGNPHPVVN